MTTLVKGVLYGVFVEFARVMLDISLHLYYLLTISKFLVSP
jgi:hypothetical protein